MSDLTRRDDCGLVRMSVMMRRVCSAMAVGLLLVAGAAGCGESDTSGAAGSSTTAPPTPSATAPTTSTARSPTQAAPTTTAPEDVEPPELVVTHPADGATVTTRTLRFEGRTEPGAVVTAWNRWDAKVDADGSWSIVLVLEPGDNLARIRAVDASGNTTEVTVRVHYRLEMSELIVGRWTGEATVPTAWSPIEDLWVEFRKDGSYSAGSTGSPAFYYGTNADYPEKVYSVKGHYPGGKPGRGTIAIVWADDGSVGTVQHGSLENIVFSDGGDRLEFDFWRTWAGRYGPVHYDLVRSDSG